MGGIGRTLFGGPSKQESESHSTTESGNHAWGPVSGAFTPALGYATSGGNMVQSLLMGSGQNENLNNFANSTGMNFVMDQGSRAITGNAAARGLLNSGSTLKALNKFGQGVGSTYLNNYMDNLFKLSNVGLQAGNVMSGAGGWSKGQSDSSGEGTGAKQGIAGTLAQIGSAIAASDRRLKSDVVKIRELSDGLNVYSYKIFGRRQIGVMADEVKKLRPEAHVPNFLGEYDGVDYSKIEELN
jgi:hypothetical protein